MNRWSRWAKKYGVFYQAPEVQTYVNTGSTMSEEEMYAFVNDIFAMYQRHNISVFGYLDSHGLEAFPYSHDFVMPANVEGTLLTFDARGNEILAKYTAPMVDTYQDRYTIEKVIIGELSVGNKSKVKAYAQPDTDSEVVYQLKKTEGFWITDVNNDWYEILLPDGSHGWIRKKDCAWGELDEKYYQVLKTLR